jgi:hypothetical protein
MRAVRCSRLCRATVLHPKHHRSIATGSQNAPERSSSIPTHRTPSTFTVYRRELPDGTVITGPRGSPDYIPKKRGYAPNIPIPPRKFNLPTIKTKKGAPDPKKAAPEPKKERHVKNYGMEYERQLNAMRRGYVHWRYETFKQKQKQKQENAMRPRPPPPAPFTPTFAEKMATPSHMDQLALEQQLFGPRTPRPERGAGYHSEHHQKLISRKRYELINDYLNLYHTSKNFITNAEELEGLITQTLSDDQIMYTALPQSYEDLVHDAEEGSIMENSYMSRMTTDKTNEIVNAMVGTVAEGKPGYEEVMKVIQDSFAAEAAAQSQSELDQTIATNSEPAGEVKTEQTLEVDNTAKENGIYTDQIAIISAQDDPSSEPSWAYAKAAADAERLAEKKSQELDLLRQRYNLLQLF